MVWYSDRTNLKVTANCPVNNAFLVDIGEKNGLIDYDNYFILPKLMMVKEQVQLYYLAVSTLAQTDQVGSSTARLMRYSLPVKFKCDN